jgi:hypothetical protein
VSPRSQETSRENNDAPPTPRVPEAGARAENKSDFNAPVPNRGSEPHAVGTARSDPASNGAAPDLGIDEAAGTSGSSGPRCGSRGSVLSRAHPSMTSTPPTTPRGANRIAMPVAQVNPLSI